MKLSPDIHASIYRYHEQRRPFVAVHPDKGVVFAAEDEDEFQAKLGDLRPSVIKQLCFVYADLWVVSGPPGEPS